MIFPYMEYILSICYKSIPVSYGSICVGPARDKEYMEMHGKENKHNQADMRGARCKDVQSPFRWLRHSLHWFHAKTVPDHYLDDSLQASPAETEVLQVFQGKSMMEWTYFTFKNMNAFYLLVYNKSASYIRGHHHQYHPFPTYKIPALIRPFWPVSCYNALD